MWKPSQFLPVLLLASAGVITASDVLEDIWGRGLQHADDVFGALVLSRQVATKNLQTFTGALGGIKADAITQSGNSQRPFEVSGDTFTSFTDAAGRSCDNQKNNCATMANNGSATFTVADCDTQNTQCHSAISNEAVTASTEGTGTSTTSSTSTSTSTSSSSSSSSSSTSTTSTTSSSISTSTTSSSSTSVVVQAPPQVATTSSAFVPAVTTALATTPVAVTTTSSSSASLALVSQNAEFNFFCEV